MTDTARPKPEKPAAQPPEWLTRREDGMAEPEKKLWDSAYAKVHDQNHYFKKEGPTQAFERLKKQGLLDDVSIDIPKEAQDKVKKELGKKGELHRNYYTSNDRVLTGDQEQKEVAGLVERQKKHDQAQRLSPTTEQINAALTPEVADQLKKAGLKVDPNRLHDQIAKQMESDKGLTSAGMEKMKGFPVGAPYVATGAVSAKEMESVLSKQKSLRDAEMQKPEYKDLSPKDLWANKQWQEFAKQTDVGHLLREDAKGNPAALAKIEAADALIKNLQNAQKPKS
jgi:hypothetical protein